MKARRYLMGLVMCMVIAASVPVWASEEADDSYDIHDEVIQDEAISEEYDSPDELADDESSICSSGDYEVILPITLMEDLYVSGNLIVSGGATLNTGGHNVYVEGSTFIDYKSSLNVNSGSVVTVLGDVYAAGTTISIYDDAILNVSRNLCIASPDGVGYSRVDSELRCGEKATLNVNGDFIYNSSASRVFIVGNQFVARNYTMHLMGDFVALSSVEFGGIVYFHSPGKSLRLDTENSYIGGIKADAAICAGPYLNIGQLHSDITVNPLAGSPYNSVKITKDVTSNGHTLTVNHNLELSANYGFAKVEDSHLVVSGYMLVKSGDFTIYDNSSAVIHGNLIFAKDAENIGSETSTANLRVNNNGGKLYVDGSFIWNSTGGMFWALGYNTPQHDSVMHLRGKYQDIYGTSFEGILDMCGDGEQVISMTAKSNIYALAPTNGNLVALDYFNVSFLRGDAHLKQSDNTTPAIRISKYMKTSANLDVTGNLALSDKLWVADKSTLNVSGDVQVTSGELLVMSGSAASIGGSLIYKDIDESGSEVTVTGGLRIDENAFVNVDGDCYFNSTGLFGYMTQYNTPSINGFIRLKGNYTSRNISEFKGTLIMLTPGSHVDANGGKIAGLVLRGDRSDFAIAEGTTYGFIEENAERVALKYSSLYIDGAVGVNMYASIPTGLRIDPGSYAMFGDQKILCRDLESKYIDGQKYWIISQRTSAKDIDKPLTISFYASDNSICQMVNAEGEPIANNCYEFKIRDYIKTVSEGSYSAQEKRIADALEKYCDCAKVYFYGSGSMPDLAEFSAGDMRVIESKAKTITDQADGIKYVGSSLLLGSQITVRHYFKLDSGKSIDQYRFRVGYNECVPVESNGMYYIDVANISAFAIGNPTSVVVNDTMTISYSPCSYIYSAYNTNNENLKTLLRGLYYFGNSR